MTGIKDNPQPIIVPPAIIVHGFAELRAALEAAAGLNRPLTVISAPGAAGSAGALWFRALIEAGHAEYPAVTLTAVLDCADQPGHALGALRAGLPHLLLRGNPQALMRVRTIAETRRAVVYQDTGPLLDLRGRCDFVCACRDWLA